MASSFTGFTLAAQGISLAKVPTPAQSVSLPPGVNVGTQQAFGADFGFGDRFNLSSNSSTPATPSTPAASSASASSQLRYPNTDWPAKQDYILFTALAYGKGGFNIKDGNVGFSKREFIHQSPTVCLPIQSKIADNNLVGWGEGRMTPIQLAAAGLSEGIIGGKIDLNETMKSLTKSAKDPLSKRASDLFFAEKASSATGLLSRIEGSIANPNLELLFQGPDLRPFTFNFIMSARDEAEATMIRKIIRFFKQNMAVQRTESNIFLKSPNIFKVEYKSSRSNGLHPSINRIKECALQALNIDYTPAGTYSTFNDAKSTMTAYTMGMSFTELEPVFADEYKKVPTDEIGF